jgi:nicotinamide-nucleotide amidase
MRAMFQDQILPHLPQTGRVILQEIVHCFGTGESDLAERIQDLLTRDGPVVAGTTVAAGLISIRISSVAKTLEHARVQADERIKAIRTRLGDLVLGVGEEATMEAVVGELLRRRGQTLATAESCTGGLLGERLTTVSGSSAYYLGGVVSYANRIKQEQLGVPPDMLAAHGAVSEPVAQAMAEGVRRMMDADWGIGITGVAGPTGGSEDKPVGTVFTSLAGPGGVRVQHHRFPGDRAMVRLRSVLAALDALRRELQAVSP